MASGIVEAGRLGSEMQMYNWQIFFGTLAILSLMIFATWASRDSKHDDMLTFILVLGIAWPFMMGRYDFLIHRIGVWLAQSGSAWEISEVRLHKRWMLLFYDAGTALPIVFLFGAAVRRTWMRPRRITAVVAVAAFLVGVGFFVSAPLVFNSLRR